MRTLRSHLALVILLVASPAVGQNTQPVSDQSATRPYHMLILGDSISWGLGLKTKNKAGSRNPTSPQEKSPSCQNIFSQNPSMRGHWCLCPFVPGSSAQKIHAAPFLCFSRGESNPRCSRRVRAPRYMFANKHCVMSDSSQPCLGRLVL